MKFVREQPPGCSSSRLRMLNWLGLSSHRAKKTRLAFHNVSAVRNRPIKAR